MKIVIDIPEDMIPTKQEIVDTYIHFIDSTVCEVGGYAFTVLPEGHGDLINREKLKSFKCAEHSSDKEDIDDYETEEERDTARDRENFYRAGWNDAVEFIIEKAPAAIPADKGERK